MKKKVALLSLCISISFLLSAQLLVHENGSLSQGYNGYANIYLGSNPNGSVDYGKWGIEVWGEDLNFWKPWPSQNNGEPNYYLYITGSGNVGIGKKPGNYKLEVLGSIACYGEINLSSDERLKKDIQPLSNKGIDLYKLNAKSYKKHLPDDELLMQEHKDKNGNLMPGKNYTRIKKVQREKTEYGFLAQELKEVYPDLVSQDTLGYYLVNYVGLIPVMVETLKEQKLQLDEQRKQINLLLEIVGNKKK